MANLKEFHSGNIDLVAQEIDRGLKELGDRLGLDISKGRGRYNSNNWTFKVTCSVLNEEGEAVPPRITDFNAKCWKYGLSPEDLGRIFICEHVRYRITGLKKSNKKYPILAERVYDGKGYKFPGTNIKKWLESTRPDQLVTVAEENEEEEISDRISSLLEQYGGDDSIEIEDYNPRCPK